MAGGSSTVAGGASAAAAMPERRKGMGAPPPPAWARVFSCVLLALAGMATAAVHKVGDAAGWTIIGNVNYTAWAAANTFRVGDTVVFQYNKQFHDVLEVNRADYRACNTQSPLATYTTGNDSVVLGRAGHHFFLCGVPGHCAVGQKLDIRIPKRTRAATAAPATAPSSASPSSPTSPPRSGGSTAVTTAAAAPVPQKSGGAARRVTGWAVALVTVALAAAA